MQLTNNLKIILLAVAAIGILALSYYLGYERKKQASFNLSQTQVTSPNPSNPAATPNPTTAALEKPCEQSEDKINCFISYLSQNPLSDNIVKSDDKLKEYFSKNLDTLTFTGISRGKFDKYSDKDITLFSLEDQDFPPLIPSYVFILKENITGKWSVSLQKLDGQEFINEPQKLITGEPVFFASNDSAYPVGDGKGFFEYTHLYRLENNEFKPIWDTVYSTEGYNPVTQDQIQIETLDTNIIYKDLNNDGNLEIIKQGNREICIEGDDFACDESKPIKKYKIYEIYKWNSQKQTFVKIN